VKRLPILILSALLALGVLTLSPGCKTAPSIERAAHNSIKASDAAVEAAIRAWGVSFADREAKNDATRAGEPGGYLDRRHELTKEYGRVVDLHGRYSDAVRASVEAWIAAKQAGLPAPLEPVATPEVDDLRAQLQAIAK
jgi:hypothetical protein